MWQGYNISFKTSRPLPGLAPVAPARWLQQAIQTGLAVGVATERARAERLVSPVLLECCERNGFCFSIHSDTGPLANPEQGLANGFTCSFGRVQDFITALVFLVVDTCYRETDEELAPLLEQLIAAHHLNESERHPTQPLYGCSTTGIEWRFLKYEGNEFILDQQRFFLSELPALLGALQAVVDAAKSGVAETSVSSQR